MGWQFFIALGIQLIQIISIRFLEGYDQLLINIMIITLVISWLLAALGILYPVTKIKTLAYLSIIGFTINIPIGLLGAIPVRKKLDEDYRLQFLKELENE